ncbi:NusG domain II-containing protein [uncultured Sphaerochaeta sp.]|uniref:NusG domain II-containing protein n=1 Tax=uncultured Sphaerochaeta sp. TaxID=886478 RepID=UPI002A0A3549|nr:NusG domain II-containing protein [uncultured Sphaerochaeta sp.]
MKQRPPTLVVDAIIFFFCLSSLFLLFAKHPAKSGGYLQVESPGGTYRYALDKDAHFHVQGPLGETEIEISEGKARIVDSPCPTKSCTHQTPISKGNGWIACLPNEILLTIVSAPDQDVEVDDVSN